MKKFVMFKYLTVLFLSSVLVACDGSSSGGSSGSTGTLTGTAATGAAIAGKTVTAVDANGVQTTTTTGTDGKFTISVDTSAKPFMLKVTTSSGDTLFSLAENGGEVANITPMTNLAMQEINKNGTSYLPLDNLFSSFKDHHSSVVTAQKIADAKGKVNATFQALMTANGVDTKTDFFKTAFNADSTKIDKVLDGLSITIDPSIKNGSIAASGITITFNGSTTAFNPNIAFSNFIPSGSGSGGSSGSLPSSVSGNVVVMTFDFLSTGKTGPVTLNTNVGFTFSSSGALFINTDNSGLDEITINSFTKVGSEYVWEDSANNFKYSLSLKTDGSINEINVNLISDGTFIGQFGTVVSNSGTTTLLGDCSSTTVGNWCLYTKYINQSIVTTPIEFTVNNFPESNVPTGSDISAAQSAAQTQFGTGLGGSVTVTSFSYTVDTKTATKIEVTVKSTGNISTGGISVPFNYDVQYVYQKK